MDSIVWSNHAFDNRPGPAYVSVYQKACMLNVSAFIHTLHVPIVRLIYIGDLFSVHRAIMY